MFMSKLFGVGDMDKVGCSEFDKVMTGSNKKSFSLFYNGGSIWCEHLDSLCDQKQLVLEKFTKDLVEIRKPSTSAYLAVNLDETVVDEEILSFILDSFVQMEKALRKVVFVGLKLKWKHYVKKRSQGVPFMTGCVDDFEKAKAWLV